MKTLKTLWGIVSSLLLISIILLTFLTLSTNITSINDYRTLLVQSGSMEPSIMTGDIIIIHKRNNYVVGDVITFQNSQERVITHRIIEVEGADDRVQFKTKGDANRTDDEDTVPLEDVLGKVVLVVPKIGFLVAFTKTPAGFIALIIVPAVFIVSSELIKIFRNA